MFNNFINLEKVDKDIIEEGLPKYLNIIEGFKSLNEPTDDFKKKFNYFYRIRQRSKTFYDAFYSLMFEYKNKNIEFSQILTTLFEKTGKVESSYSSKLLHTINPNKPIWDKFVLMNLNINKSRYGKDKIQFSIDTYKKIEDFYNEFLLTEDAKRYIEFFDTNFPKGIQISNIKKIDFLLWASRDENNKENKFNIKLKLEFDGIVADHLRKIDDKNNYIKELIINDLKNKV